MFEPQDRIFMSIFVISKKSAFRKGAMLRGCDFFFFFFEAVGNDLPVPVFNVLRLDSLNVLCPLALGFVFW